MMFFQVITVCRRLTQRASSWHTGFSRMSPLAPRLAFFTRGSFQGSALERTVPLALP